MIFDKQKVDKLNEMEKKVYFYILENENELHNLRITDVASENYTSTTTVIRMCKKLGFKGFGELKYSLIHSNQQVQPLDISDNSPSGHALLKMKKEINNTLDMLEVDQLEKAADLIHNARKVHIYGVGFNSTLIQFPVRALQLMFKTAHYFVEPHIMYLNAERLTEDDLVIAVSISGESIDTFKATNIAKAQNAKIITITNQGSNSINDLSDISFSTYVETIPQSDFDMKNRVPAMILLQTLIETYVYKYGRED